VTSQEGLSSVTLVTENISVSTVPIGSNRAPDSIISSVVQLD
jgi:hypothetical protein